MARQYSAKTFLRNTPNTLLERYFRQHRIDLGVPWLRLYETDVDPIFLGLERKREGGAGHRLELAYVFSRVVVFQSPTPNYNSGDTIMLRAGIEF